MNQSTAAVVDLEAATDQLVDELCARFTALYGLLGIPLSEHGLPVDMIRARATEVVCGLAGGQPTATAVAIARALWPPQTMTRVPRSWWDTPLGNVLAEARVPTTVPAVPTARRDRPRRSANGRIEERR